MSSFQDTEADMYVTKRNQQREIMSFDKILKRIKNIRLYEGESYCDYNPNLQRFWIEAHGNINYCLKLIKNESFVVINMSKFKYPGVEDNLKI